MGPSGEPKPPVELSALEAEKMTISLTEGVRFGRSLLMTKSFLSQAGSADSAREWAGSVALEDGTLCPQRALA